MDRANFNAIFEASEEFRTLRAKADSMGITIPPLDKTIDEFFDKQEQTNNEKSSSSEKQRRKEKVKVKLTRLEKQLELHADCRECMNEEKYDEAFGNLLSLLKLGEEGCFAPTLINYYKTLVRTGRVEASEEIMERLVAIVGERMHGTPKECELLADKYRGDSEHVKAILFYQIAGALYNSDVETQEIANCFQGCILGLKISAGKLIKERPDLRYIITPYIVPALRKLYSKLLFLKTSQPKGMTLTAAVCLHHIETTELKAEDPTLREATLREQVDLLERKFGNDAKKHFLYSAALNNLGVTLYSMHKPREAKEVLLKAIEARNGAQDYETQIEKESDLKMTEGALKQVEEMLGFMQE